MFNKKSLTTSITTLSIIIISITVLLVAMPVYRLTMESSEGLKEVISVDEDDLRSLGRSSGRFSSTKNKIFVDNEIFYLFPTVIRNIFQDDYFFFIELDCTNCDVSSPFISQNDDKNVFGPYFVDSNDYQIIELGFLLNESYEKDEYDIEATAYYNQTYSDWNSNWKDSEYDTFSFSLVLS